MGVSVRRYTVEEFEAFVLQPENADRRFEFVGGEIVEVVSNSYASETAANILAEIRMFIKGKNLGRITGADGGYVVAGERYIPDVAFISLARQSEPSREAYNAIAPDLAVEVISPSDALHTLRIKISNYLAAGTVVWVVDPEKQVVEVHAPGQPVQVLDADGTLDGGAVLPGFTLKVSEIFPE